MNDVTSQARQPAEIVGQLTLDEKAALTAGFDMWTTSPVERLGIPAVRFTDGPNGARGRFWGPGGTRALALPTGSALGATWNPTLLRQVGAELGREARARSARLLLGPTVNPQRAPLAGRTFECFSEDPLLSGVLGAEYVCGVQSEGVIATVKHLAGNEAEWQRNSVDSVIDERTLREVYLLPFERCVRAGAMAVMTAYNRLNGDHCPNLGWLLRDILRGEWGFEGIVMTDWWGLVDTRAAADAGLDLEMPGPGRSYGKALAAAVRAGEVAEEALDRIVVRLLDVFARTGALDDPGGAEGEWTRDGPTQSRFARTVSAASIVLVKNEGRLLPLALDEARRIAIIGPNAAAAEIMGGGSSQVRAHHRTPLLAALHRRWGDHHHLVHEPGVASAADPTPLESWELTSPSGEPGLLVEYFDGPDLVGPPVAVHQGDDFRLQHLGAPGPGLSFPDVALRASATFTATETGEHELVLRSNGPAKLIIDGGQVGALAPDNQAGSFDRARELDWSTFLRSGQALHLAVEYTNTAADAYGRMSLACRRPPPPDGLDRAARAAAGCDLAIVIVGTSDLVESEGYDRRRLALPDDQDALIARVIEANQRTVVVVNSGGPVAMPWLGAAPAVLQAWFGGQEMGDALADVLEGSAEPAGRMPFTVPVRIEDTPTFGNFPGEAGAVRYGEGLLVGYRWYDSRDIEVSVPFGHGGSYTTFDWSGIRLSANELEIGVGEPVSVEVTVINTGDRPGSEVVQVYVAPPETTPVFRPRRELKGFARVDLEPGERRRLVIDLDWRSFAYWTPHDTSAAYHERVLSTPFASTVPGRVAPEGWTVVGGDYRVQVARSVTDIEAELPLRLAGSIEGRR